MAKKKKRRRSKRGPKQAARNQRARTKGATSSLLPNLLILAVAGWAWLLNEIDQDLYYRTLQEDGYLEWATVVAFVAAAVLAAVAARRQYRKDGAVPWFLAGVGLFCVFVAGEEISWGQRLLSYRPPVYFLENNFQQELNLHNVMDTSLRKLGLKSVLLVYGVALGIAGQIQSLRRYLHEWSIVAPPAGLAIGFFVTYWLYQEYPWSFTGEIVELMLGFGFLFALLANARGFAGAAEPLEARWWSGHQVQVALCFALTMAAGVAVAGAADAAARNDTGRIGETENETRLLAEDFERRSNRSISRCGIHKRIYSYLEKYEKTELLEGRFAALKEQGLAPERADYFLDPWNNPYWIRHECSEDRDSRRAFVYSFGPNHKRDSSEWVLRGDDIGVVIESRGDLPPEAGAE